jgi:Tfp pilus assembly protein PilX
MTYTEKIIDINTGEETIRPLTDEETAAIDATLAQLAAEQALRDAEQASKDAARQAVLDKLGLTADEVTALLN